MQSTQLQKMFENRISHHHTEITVLPSHILGAHHNVPEQVIALIRYIQLSTNKVDDTLTVT